MLDAGKITGIISENTDIFVLPDQNGGNATNPKEGFLCRSSKETYTCIIIFISTFREMLNRWFPGLIREPIPVRVRSGRRADTHQRGSFTGI